MEKEIKELLKNIIEKEDERREAIENAKNNIENCKKREDMSLKRFETKFREDIDAGIFDFTDGQRDREIENGKAKISQDYKAEREELEAKLLELEQAEENVEPQTGKIVLALRKYRDDMMRSQYKVQKEVKNIEDRANIAEEQKMQELAELDKQIREKEAKYTHLIMRNRNLINVQNRDTIDINLLSKELEELKLQKGEIITRYQEQLDALGNQKEQLNNEIAEFDAKIENVNQFFGKIEVKDKTAKEIYEMLFNEEVKQEIQDEEIIIELEQKENEEPIKEEEKVEEQVVHEDAKVEEEVAQEDVKEEDVVVQEETNQEPEEEEIKVVIKEELHKEVPVVENSKEVDKNACEFIIEEISEEEPAKENPVDKTSNNIEAKKVNPVESVVENNNVEEDKKFTYEFSINGIKYDGARIRNNQLLKWYSDYKDDIESAIQKVMGDKKRIHEFLHSADKLVYLSIMSKDLEQSDDGKMKVGPTATKRLEEYYKIWDNPNSKESSNMEIKYNLKGISPLSSIFGKRPFTREDIREIKDTVYLLRNRENVKIENMSKLTSLEFKLKEWKEKMQAAKDTKALGDGKKEDKTGKNSTVKEKRDAFKQFLREHAKKQEGTQEATTNNSLENVQGHNTQTEDKDR